MDQQVEEQSSPLETVSIHQPVTIVELFIKHPHQPMDALPSKMTMFVTMRNEGDFPLPSISSWCESGLLLASAPTQALPEPILRPVGGTKEKEGDDGR